MHTLLHLTAKSIAIDRAAWHYILNIKYLRMYFWWSLCTLYLHAHRMPGESYCRQLRSLLYLRYVFQALITFSNSYIF